MTIQEQAMQSLEDILSVVRAKIAAAAARAGRRADDVEIIAVTKTHGEEVVREAWEAGLRIVGENKVQEAMWKKAQSLSGPEWHLIGHLQSNKVRHALETFDFIHSVDSVKLADKINQVADQMGSRPRILFEVNVSGEKSKSGMPPEAVADAIAHVMESCPRITLEGFMTMAPICEEQEEARPFFRRLRLLRDEMEARFNASFPRLSMGMSGDYEVAVEEGATWVRLGTVLFGERPKVKAMRREGDGDDVPLGGLDSYSGAGPTVRVLD